MKYVKLTAHVHWNFLGGSMGRHLLEFRDRGRTRLFEVHARAAHLNDLFQQTWVVCSAARDQSHFLTARRGSGYCRYGGMEINTPFLPLVF